MARRITKQMSNYLAYHAFELEDKKIEVANAYSREYDAYVRMLNFINAYTGEIEQFIYATETKTGEMEPPFVILGSVVQIKDSDSDAICRYKIVLPGKVKPITSAGIMTADCFSAIGRLLLFKQKGDVVQVPGEEKPHSFIIEKISYETNPITYVNGNNACG